MENLKKRELRHKRGGIGNSLISSALQDVTKTNKIRSEFNSGAG